MKSLLMRAIPLACCLSLAAPGLSQPVPAQATATAPKPLTAEQWREDLRFMVAEMRRRHENLHHKVSREAFDAAVAELDRRIPSLQRNQVIVGMMRIAAMVGDGHTRVDPRKDAKFGFPSLPLKLYLFDDGLFVRAARPDHGRLVGARIVAIGGVPVEEAIRRTHAISSVDNEIGYRLFAPLYLNMPDVLHALGLSPTSGSAVLTLRKAGRTWTGTIGAGEVEALWPPDTDVSLVTPEGWIDANGKSPPLWLQAPLDYHRLVPLPDRNALYAQVNMITGIDGQTLAQFGRKIREQAETANPRAVVLDLRLSYGGNHDLRHDFVREMVKTEDADTRLFVLTWRGSFSATEAFLVDLDRLTDAVFVGEPASSKPNSYGDAYRTALPNSGISIRTSIDWNQLKGQSRDPWTWVDVAAPLSFADYAAGRDPALEAALGYRPVPTLTDKLRQAKGSPATIRILEAHRADPRNRYANIERQMQAAAERLARDKKVELSLIVAEQNARWFPRSADAQLVLGFLAERAGKLELAKAAGERTVQIDPDSRGARALLERLSQKEGK